MQPVPRIVRSRARGSEPVAIGAAARASGMSAKMIRHYEDIGLLPAAKRTPAGYRTCGASAIHTLRFVKRSRELGFSMAEIRKLLAPWNDRRRASAEVKRLALKQVAELDRRIAQLESMRGALAGLARHCHGDQRPECPILDDLAAGARP